MLVGSLFSGIGLLDYGLTLAGHTHGWFAERDRYRRRIIALRFPGVPVYPDVRAVGLAAPRVDLVAGGFPCKGVSQAGAHAGFGHPETALWREMLRVVRELRPRYVLVENVADLLVLHGGDCFGEVLGSLAECGYDTEWVCIRASAFGAPHRRERVFVVAAATDPEPMARPTADRGKPGPPEGGEQTAHPRAPRRPVDRATRSARGTPIGVEWGRYARAVARWEETLGRAAPEPFVRGVDDGRARRVERPRIAALGDGVLVQAGRMIGERLRAYDETVAA